MDFREFEQKSWSLKPAVARHISDAAVPVLVRMHWPLHMVVLVPLGKEVASYVSFSCEIASLRSGIDKIKRERGVEAGDQGVGGLGRTRQLFVEIFYSAVLVHHQCNNQTNEPHSLPRYGRNRKARFWKMPKLSLT